MSLKHTVFAALLCFENVGLLCFVVRCFFVLVFASETQKNPKRRSGSETHLFCCFETHRVLLKPQSGSWGSSRSKKNTRVVLQSSEHQSGSSALKRSNSLLLLCFFFFLKHSMFQRCVSEESFSKRCVSEPLLSQKKKKAVLSTNK